jgi:hypothetical protein
LQSCPHRLHNPVVQLLGPLFRQPPLSQHLLIYPMSGWAKTTPPPSGGRGIFMSTPDPSSAPSAAERLCLL